MKRVILFSIFLFSAVIVFGQIPDSVALNDGNQVITSLKDTPLGIKIVAAIGVLSEVLSLIPAKYVPANGVLHGIWLLLKGAPKS